MRIFFSILAFSSFWGSAKGADYEVEKAHSNVKFEVAHLVISTVSGRFTDFTGKLDFNEKAELVGVTGEVNAASINTDNEKRDKHLRSEDFFYSQKFPQLILFKFRFFQTASRGSGPACAGESLKWSVECENVF